MAKNNRGKVADVVGGMERDLESAQGKLQEQANQIAAFKSELEKERRLTSRLKGEIERHKQNPLHDQLKESKRELKDEQGKNQPKKLRKRIQSLEEANSKLTSENVRLTGEQELDKLEAAKRKALDDLKASRKYNDDMREELAEAQSEKKDLADQLAEREADIEKLDVSLEETKGHLRVSVAKNNPKPKSEPEPEEDEPASPTE